MQSVLTEKTEGPIKIKEKGEHEETMMSEDKTKQKRQCLNICAMNN